MHWNPFGRLTLLARFTILSFTITLAIAASLGFVLTSQLEQSALWKQAETTAQQVKFDVNTNIRPSDLTQPLTPQRYAEIDRLVHSLLTDPGIVHSKIWSLKGTLLYSDETQLIGQQFPLSAELESAFRNQMATEVSSLDKPENIGERGQFKQLFEIYVPILPTNSDKVLGAFEVYYNLAVLQPQLTAIRSTVWGGVGLGFLILYAAVFLMVRNASQELAQRSEENRRLFAAEHEQRQLSETLGRVGLALSGVLELQKLLDMICQESTLVFKCSTAFLWLVEGDELIGFAAHGPGAEKFMGMRFPLDDPELLGARVARERRPILINNAPKSAEVRQELIQLFEIRSMLGVPLIKGDQTLGSLMILDNRRPQHFHQLDLETAGVFGSYAAVAIDKAQLYEDAQRHLQHEQSLREIDRAISSSLDLEFTLQIVLKQALTQLQADAADILLFDRTDQALVFGAELGFKRREIRKFRLRVGNGVAGQAALQRQTILVHNIAGSTEIIGRKDWLTAEGFVSMAAVPLIAKGKILGVLEVFQRSPLTSKQDWFDFLASLAGQAGIAIDNASLFSDLQRSSLELAQAYDATIEGWSRALDLRDRETEGHTQRVTELTLELARAMSIAESELVQIRRGSLLHDIGKMGVPDNILLKPASLTEDEWISMRKHPVFAYEMLSPIAFLRSALQIPYSHHEKWDGTGYPRGLKGEEIPLAARLFSVADVYDALTSDRPYRNAWPHQKALEYIQEQAGKQFDPQVVDLFIRVRPGRLNVES